VIATPSSFAPFDPEPIRRCLEELIGKDPDSAYFRTIRPGSGANKARKGADLLGFDPAALLADNKAGQNIYMVVGRATAASGVNKETGEPTGAVIDDDVADCPCLFVEWDDRPKVEQLRAWEELGLPEPTVMIDSGGKSVHVYWRMVEPITPAQWTEATARLIAHCGSDRTCSNLSRLMRVPGFAYIDKKTTKPTGGKAEVIHASGRSYSLQEVLDCIPARASLHEEPAPAAPQRPRLQLVSPPPPRSLEEVNAAAEFIPVRVGGEGTYEQDRNALCGCSAALAEAGCADPDAAALALLGGKWPSHKDADHCLATTTTRNAASFWAIAKAGGYDTRRHDLRGKDDDLAGFIDQSGRQQQEPQAPPLAMAKPKRHTLAPDEVMVHLPARLGQPRLNIRTNEFHAGSNTYSADDVARLYLKLSSPQERWPKDTTADALVELAKDHAFDPVEEELNRIGSTVEPLPLDQWERLDRHLLGIDDPIAAAFLPQFLISAVARVFRPGCSVRRSPVLIGAQQRGKTELGEILFGKEHWVENVSNLDKDDQMRLQTGWGIELSELNGLTRRKDQESLKAFLTAKWDDFRAPYGKGVAKYQRRCVFWGTSNGPPLRDLSGSTRFVCIPIPDRMLPLDWATEHRDAIWSRAVEQFRLIAPGKEPWDRVSEEDRAALQERNSNHQELDPWAEEVAQRLREATQRPVSAAYILDRMDIPKSQRNNAMAARVRQLAEAIGWVMERRSVAGERRMGFWPPEPASQPPAEDAAAIALPHLPQPCHSAATPADASQGNGSAPAAIPAIPNPSKLEKEEEGSTPPAPTPAAAAARGEVFGSFGVAGAAAPPDASLGQASGPVSAMAGAMAGGVAAVWQEPPNPELLPWLAQISQLRSQYPTDAPHTLALKLFARHGLRTTGRAIRDLEPWIAAQPVEEF
jgi:hypothetical protein